jgi:hypothetical protein
MEQTTLSGLTAKLQGLLDAQATEVERLKKLSPVAHTATIPAPTSDGQVLIHPKAWNNLNTKEQLKFLKQNVSLPGVNVQLLSAEKSVADAKTKPKVADGEYEKLNGLKQDIKTVMGQIADLTKVKIPSGSGVRAAASANGANAKPAGFYKVTDEIRKAMNVRNEHKVGKDIVATYTVTNADGSKRDCTSKIVNAAIAYHRQEKVAAK